MKRILSLMAMLLVAGVMVSFGQGLLGSKHDFTNASWQAVSDTNDRVCGPCHTPHGSRAGMSDIPLWSHDTTQVAAFTLYSSNTLNVTPGQPTGVSKMCLSCHDGTISLNAHIGGEGSGDAIGAVNGGAALVGTVLDNDHPISFVYGSAVDGGIHDPTSTASGMPAGGDIEDDLLFGGATGTRTMECGSCHDVHNASNQPFLLQKDNTNSELCLTCHNK